MQVNEAPDVRLFNQLRQAGIGRLLHLTEILSQLRRDIIEPQGTMDLFFPRTLDQLIPAEEPVLVELQAKLPGQSTQGGIVLLRTCKVAEGKGELCLFHNSEIHTESIRTSDTGLGLSPGDNRIEPGPGANVLNHSRWF